MYTYSSSNNGLSTLMWGTLTGVKGYIQDQFAPEYLLNEDVKIYELVLASTPELLSGVVWDDADDTPF